MEALLFAVNGVLPVILPVGLGYVLKRIGWMDAALAAKLNKIVFRVLLPCMLFSNVAGMSASLGAGLGYVGFCLAVELAVFLLTIPSVMVLTPESGRRGALLQASFRSNFALIGIPLAQSLCGGEGVAAASLLSAALIPAFNVLAVVSLSLFGDGKQKLSGKKILWGIAKNPLILSVLAGLLFFGLSRFLNARGIAFSLSDTGALHKTLSSLAGAATPLALLSLGAQFEFSAVGQMKKEILFGVAVRTLIVPAVGLSAALLLRDRFAAAQFACFVSAFATPVAVSSVPMAQEMKADAALAGQLVVWTTLVSALSIFVATWVLRAVGEFG